MVNLSIGDYMAAMTGLIAALLIDSMLNASPGRAVVPAAGNSSLHQQLPVAHDARG